MSSEKRLVLFLILTMLSVVGIQYLVEVSGLAPRPPRRPPVAQAKGAGAQPAPAAGKAGKGSQAAPPEKAVAEAPPPLQPPAAARGKKSNVALVEPTELVLGSTNAQSGYHLRVELDQKGAGVGKVESSQYEAEFKPGLPPHRPLELLSRDPRSPASLTYTLMPDAAGRPKLAGEAEGDVAPAAVAEAEIPLDAVTWDVVRDNHGRAARPIPQDAMSAAEETGREVDFRTTLDDLGVVLTKTYRLKKGTDAIELTLGFESPAAERSLVYRLLGPHGIPIEGEWYTSTFRDVFFGLVDRGGGVKVNAKTAYDVAKAKDPEPFLTLPLKFAGIENQYFAAFVEPVPTPRTDEERWDAKAFAIAMPPLDPGALQKADVSVQIDSKPVKVGPNLALTHTYNLFAGPKTVAALAPYGAEALASYHKYQWFSIPGAAWLAMNVIAPLLDHIYELTRRVAILFGWKSGNYGIAIILLTLLVRMMMFPLSRKQAIAAKKMQELQPLMKELQEKYKDDKERQTKETFALYKKHGVNPVSGCLPALIQLPIFVGLWQALNNSVHLRHASFLYIRDLAAPDMLFRFPTELPFVGEYFNLLPFLVVALMLVQTKLFSPPATTPEAEAQQKMMKYMMIFMAFMFYKVPSGLGIYFITSSLWQISERLLLPRLTKADLKPATAPDEGKEPPGDGRGGPDGGGGGGRGGPDDDGKPGKPGGWLAQRLEKLLDDAAKEKTIRNNGKEAERNRDKGRPRARPGRRGNAQGGPRAGARGGPPQNARPRRPDGKVLESLLESLLGGDATRRKERDEGKEKGQ